ncbi:hypothetical protein VTI74DRAFT_8386 [Chaetomium olivicolor]
MSIESFFLRPTDGEAAVVVDTYLVGVERTLNKFSQNIDRSYCVGHGVFGYRGAPGRKIRECGAELQTIQARASRQLEEHVFVWVLSRPHRPGIPRLGTGNPVYRRLMGNRHVRCCVGVFDVGIVRFGTRGLLFLRVCCLFIMLPNEEIFMIRRIFLKQLLIRSLPSRPPRTHHRGSRRLRSHWSRPPNSSLSQLVPHLVLLLSILSSAEAWQSFFLALTESTKSARSTTSGLLCLRRDERLGVDAGLEERLPTAG